MDNMLSGLPSGWKIFPCHSIIDGRCTCSKGAKCESPGKHPRTRQGVKDATSDPSVVMQWAKTWPETNWALACGEASGVVVIDLDPRHGGYDSFDEYEQQRRQGALPATLRSLTGGGGRHFFFGYPQGASIPNRVNWLPGVDIRSNGGYVILPPGTHISGGSYVWENEEAMAILPGDVAEAFADRQVSKSAASGYRDSDALLKGIPKGERDDSLFRWACRLRRQNSSDVDGGLAVVTHLVLAAAEKSGFPKDEALKCVDSAFRQDHSDPAKELLPLSEIGCRDRFIEAHGDDIRFVPEIGWYTWSDRGWSSMKTEALRYLLEDVTRILREEASEVLDSKQAKEYDFWINRTQSATGLRAIEALLQQHPGIVRALDDFDRNPDELACLNGIVDLRNGEIRPFSRNDLVTKNTNVNYDPNAKSQLWMDYLATSVQGDMDLLDYLQLAAGYTATGLTTDESFFIISGPRSSGKSTYLDALQTALGTYAMTVQSDVFMYRRGKDPENELARIAGARMVGIPEIQEGDYFNNKLVKSTVTGDRITGRHLYKQAFEFVPQFKLWIATNHDPMSTDAALMRRLKRVSFSHSLPKEDRDPYLKRAVKTTESEAVLAWIIEGAKKFYAAGTGQLEEPASIIAAVEAYKADQDIIGLFLNDAVVHIEGAKTSFVSLFVAYADWCDRLKLHPGKPAPFRREMAERGLACRMEDNGTQYFEGIAVSASASLNRPWA